MMFQAVRVVFVSLTLLCVSCASWSNNTLGRFRGQTFAGILLVGNGSTEEVFQAGGYLQEKLKESGVSFCNNCFELQKRVGTQNLEAFNIVEARLLLGRLEVHPETKQSSGKPKPAWGIVTFKREHGRIATVDFEVITDLTDQEFEEIVARRNSSRWQAESGPINRLLLF